MLGSWGYDGKIFIMFRSYSLVLGMEIKFFYIVVRDEGYSEVVGIGVECGGRYFFIYFVRS